MILGWFLQTPPSLYLLTKYDRTQIIIMLQEFMLQCECAVANLD